MTIGKGLKVELFASEKEFPELVNPVQMAFDTRGRLWVAAWKNYPHWQPKTPMDDKLLILEDTDGDGKADKRTVFAGDLNNPTGFEFYNGGVILAQAPNLVFLKDTNGDDRVRHEGDHPQRPRHRRHPSHDQQLHVRSGWGAVHAGRASSTASRSKRHGGRRCARPMAACSGSSRARAKFEVYIPMNFPNPHGHVFDSWGRDIVFDATGGQPYYGPSFSTKKYYPAMETNKAPRPGTVRTRPGRRRRDPVEPSFPRRDAGQHRRAQHDRIQGAAQLQAERGRRRPEVGRGASRFSVGRREFPPRGRGSRARRRAVFRSTGTTRSSGTCSTTCATRRAITLHGRVYRVTYPGTAAAQAREDRRASRSIALLDLLKEPEDRVRYRAKIELSGRDTKDVMAALQAWMDRLDPKDPTTSTT